jgi:type II secretion system protein D
MFRTARIRKFTALLALAATLPLPLSAQPPAPPMENPPVENIGGPVPGAPEEDHVTVLADGASLDLFISNYQLLTGQIVIHDSQLDTGLPITITLPPTGQKPNREQAIRLIEKTLMLNGYVFLPSGDNTVKLMNWQAKSPRTQPVRIFSDIIDLPEGEEVVSYFMRLDYMNVAEASTVFGSVVQSNGWDVIVPVPNVNALMITGNSAIIRSLVRMKELMDRPSAQVESEFVKLIRADAERVAETITTLIEESAQAQGGTTTTRTNVVAAPQNDPNAPPPVPNAGTAVNVNVSSSSTGLSEGGLVPGTVKLVPDVRTNSILVITRKTNMPIIKDLIAKFDRPSEVPAPFERQLYYRKPTEILPTLQNLLADEDAGGGGGGGAVATPGGAGGGVSNLTGGAGTNRGTNRTTGGGANSIGGGGGAGGAGALSQQAPAEDQPPTSVVVGKTILIADDRANSILISGPGENIEKVVQMIDALDVRPRQVYISSVIGQLNLNNRTEFGITYLQRFLNINANGYNGGIASSLVTNNPPITGGGTDGDGNPIAGGFVNSIDLQQPSDFLNRSGLTLYGTVADSLDVYVNALETGTKFKTLARPTVFTTNNKQAIISSGQSIPVPTSSVSNLVSGDSTAVTSNIGYEDVELTLGIIPQVNANREVYMQIEQTNNNVLGSVVISGNEVPTIATQQLVTNVTVPDRGIVVLGGLISESDEKNRSGLPILGNLPILGPLFSSRVKEKIRSELIVMIQPTVIDNEQELYYKSYAEEANADVGGASHLHLQGREPEIRRAQPAIPGGGNEIYVVPQGK